MIPAKPILFLLGIMSIMLGIYYTALLVARWLQARADARDRATKGAAGLAALALVAILYGSNKTPQPSFSFDTYLVDTGSYATNDLVYVSVVQNPGIETYLGSCPVLVYYREISAANSDPWTTLATTDELSTFPRSYQLAAATNYNYLIYLDYTPGPAVRTNGVFNLYGYPLPPLTNDTQTAAAFNGTAIKKENTQNEENE